PQRREKRRDFGLEAFLCVLRVSAVYSGNSVRADEIIKLQRRALIEASIGSGRTDENAGIGKVNAQRRAPGVDVLALAVHFEFASDQNGDLPGILTLERLGDLGVAA